jgi:hypothetical protein
MVDFATPIRSMESYFPIGVWCASPDGSSVELRYQSEVEEEPHDNYLRTMSVLGGVLDAWRRGDAVRWDVELVRAAGNDYLGLRFRTLSQVDDEVTIDEAYEQFVVRQEPLPEVELKELPGEYV